MGARGRPEGAAPCTGDTAAAACSTNPYLRLASSSSEPLQTTLRCSKLLPIGCFHAITYCLQRSTDTLPPPNSALSHSSYSTRTGAGGS